MAKKNIHSNLATVSSIPTGLLFSDPKQNWGRIDSQHSDESVLKALRRSLAEQSWQKNDLVECREMTAEEQAIYHAQRVAEHKKLCEAAEAQTATREVKDYLKVWEALFCDEAGKVKKPKYLVMSGNQRFSQVVDASLDRFKIGCKEKWGALGVEAPVNPEDGQPLVVEPVEYPEMWVISHIPMQIAVYASLKEQIEAQQKENNLKTVGNQEPSRLDIALAAKKWIEIAGYLPTESELARRFGIGKRGAQQDVWRIVAVDYYGGEELRFLARCCLKDSNGNPDVTNPDYINWNWRLTDNYIPDGKKLSTRMIQRQNHEWVEKQRQNMKVNGKDPSEWPEHGTKAEFVEFFNWRPSGEETAPVKMNHVKMEEAANSFGADFLKDFLAGARSGSLKDFTAKYADVAQIINMVCRMTQNCGKELVETLLATINTSENPTLMLEDIIGYISPDESSDSSSVKGEVTGSLHLEHNPDVQDAEFVETNA